MEHLNEIIENIVPFLFAGTVVFIVFYFRHARRREAEQTIRMAIEKGQVLDAGVIEKLLEPPRRYGPGRLRVGGIIVAFVGVGLAAMYFILGNEDGGDRGLLGAGALVGSIGIGLLVASLAKPAQPTLPPQV